MLQIHGVIGGDARTFTLGIGKAAQAKHGFRDGDQVSGFCVRVAAPGGHPTTATATAT